MRAFPAALERLTEQFARLPGIGMKSAQRLAFYVLSLPKEDADSFAQAIVDAKNSVRLCPVCQNLTDQELCGVCADPERDHSLICVVAEPKDVIAMERAREYHGVYHVLHGVISPLSHVGPDDLRIRELISRVSQGGVREVIMATNPDTEGEATAMYLSRLLRPMDVKVTRLAYGIPVGSQHLPLARAEADSRRSSFAVCAALLLAGIILTFFRRAGLWPLGTAAYLTLRLLTLAKRTGE